MKLDDLSLQSDITFQKGVQCNTFEKCRNRVWISFLQQSHRRASSDPCSECGKCSQICYQQLQSGCWDSWWLDPWDSSHFREDQDVLPRLYYWLCFQADSNWYRASCQHLKMKIKSWLLKCYLFDRTKFPFQSFLKETLSWDFLKTCMFICNIYKQ